jgi:hypothetical protein
MLFDPQKWAMPEVRESESVEVLKAARARIMQRWCNKAGADDQGGVCAQIAITRSADWTHNDFLRGKADKTLDYLHRAINEGQSQPLRLHRRGDYDMSIIEWNDAPGRTQAEVVAAFDRAIELARADD